MTTTPASPSLSPPAFKADSDAEEVLSALWGQRGFPVDPAWISNALGVKVVSMTLPKDVSGALIKEPWKDPVITLETTDSKNRKRFSCAHELGHYIGRLKYQFGEEGQYEYVDFRGAMARQGTDPEEIYANKFAACLLMPEEEVRKRVAEGYSSIGLANYFGVSPEAMGYRLRNLRLSSN